MRSPQCACMQRIDKSMPSNKYLKLTEGLTRRQASWLIQLRTGHAPLQAHLHRIQGPEGRFTSVHTLRKGTRDGSTLFDHLPSVYGAAEEIGGSRPGGEGHGKAVESRQDFAAPMGVHCGHRSLQMMAGLRGWEVYGRWGASFSGGT